MDLEEAHEIKRGAEMWDEHEFFIRPDDGVSFMMSYGG